jgi:hypothetical protein
VVALWLEIQNILLIILSKGTACRALTVPVIMGNIFAGFLTRWNHSHPVLAKVVAPFLVR